MSSKLRSLIALSCLAPIGAMADAPTVYGRINLTAQQNSTEALKLEANDTVSTSKSDTTTLENNVSRLGFKGSEKFADIGLEGFIWPNTRCMRMTAPMALSQPLQARLLFVNVIFILD